MNREKRLARREFWGAKDSHFASHRNQEKGKRGSGATFDTKANFLQALLIPKVEQVPYLRTVPPRIESGQL